MTAQANILSNYQELGQKVSVRNQTGLIGGFRIVEDGGGWIRLENEDGSEVATINIEGINEVQKA